MAELIKPIMLDETGQSIVDAIKDITVTFEGKSGMPMGGTTNQILQKKSDTNYDAEWVDNISLDGYAKTVDVPTKVSQLENDEGYLTEHQDISQLATKAEVNAVDTKVDTKSTVSIAKEGTTTSIARYITVDGTEYKLPDREGELHILTGISVTTPPTKTSYKAGESISLTGMVVMATYADDNNEDITAECVFSPTQDTVIYEDTNSILISWENKGVTYTTTQEITVARVLTEITVTQAPTKTEYELNEALDLSGMIITAIFNSGNTAVVTGYTTDPVEGYVFTENRKVTLTITYTENEITKTATTQIIAGNPVVLVDWATGTDAEIVAMIEAADNGEIDLHDYWAVGDTRTVNLSAMSATNVGESHAAQTVEFVLMDATCTGFKFTSNNQTPRFIVGMKNCLDEKGYMNSSHTNSNGWSGCARRTWCNNEFYNSIPSTLRAIFKQFTWQQGKGGGATSGLLTTQDYFGLTPEKAVFGSRRYSQSDEAALFSQWTWYATSSNRVKTINGSANLWWECSPHSGASNYFCLVYSDGSAYYYITSTSHGLAPFGCI